MAQLLDSVNFLSQFIPFFQLKNAYNNKVHTD